jgi:type IV secretory pathway TrbL component
MRWKHFTISTITIVDNASANAITNSSKPKSVARLNTSAIGSMKTTALVSSNAGKNGYFKRLRRIKKGTSFQVEAVSQVCRACADIKQKCGCGKKKEDFFENGFHCRFLRIKVLPQLNISRQ